MLKNTLLIELNGLQFIFVVIGTGLYFSYIQLKTKNNETPQTSIKISKEGLEINSPFIGLLILGLSFVFFYIYLKDVSLAPTRRRGSKYALTSKKLKATFPRQRVGTRK